MMKALKREGLEPTAESMKILADRYTEAFQNDTKDLNILPPDKWAKATEYVPQMIDLIKKLEKNGFTYQTKQAIYFDISKFPEYGSLFLGQNLDEKKMGIREDVGRDSEKKHPADFALWFFLYGDFEHVVQHWPSPWGEGFPSWHIECSAMGITELGENFDLHTGGIDHMTKHHPNEIAQNWGVLGHHVVNYWLHNEFLTVGGTGRMAKSEGNFITMSTIKEKGIDPIAYRYLLLFTHYRKKIEFTWEALEAAKNGLDNLRSQLRDLNGDGGKIDDNFKQKFIKSINDDLNTPQALALVQEVMKSDIAPADKIATVLDFDKVLGLSLNQYAGKKEDIPAEVSKLAEERKEAKEKKDYAKADDIRGKIEKAGYNIEDLSDGNYKIVKK